MASGANDHPSSATFLQVYKLLSAYSILKPPKYGNCTVEADTINENLIKISDIKSIYASKDLSAFEKLKTKLDNIINQGEWEFTDVFEHDYSLAPIVDCLKYYIVGYLSHQIMKRTTCSKCKSCLTSPQNYSAEALLTNIKSKGWLKHPNIYLYNLMSAIEDEFQKYCENLTVFDDIVEGLITKFETFTFPCVEHKDYIISYSIKYYISMRMRQYTRQTNQDKSKENLKKKKLSKFCKT